MVLHSQSITPRALPSEFAMICRKSAELCRLNFFARDTQLFLKIKLNHSMKIGYCAHKAIDQKRTPIRQLQSGAEGKTAVAPVSLLFKSLGSGATHGKEAVLHSKNNLRRTLRNSRLPAADCYGARNSDRLHLQRNWRRNNQRSRFYRCLQLHLCWRHERRSNRSGQSLSFPTQPVPSRKAERLTPSILSSGSSPTLIHCFHESDSSTPTSPTGSRSITARSLDIISAARSVQSPHQSPATLQAFCSQPWAEQPGSRWTQGSIN
jgi:hypothetical protein